MKMEDRNGDGRVKRSDDGKSSKLPESRSVNVLKEYMLGGRLDTRGWSWYDGEVETDDQVVQVSKPLCRHISQFRPQLLGPNRRFDRKKQEPELPASPVQVCNRTALRRMNRISSYHQTGIRPGGLGWLSADARGRQRERLKIGKNCLWWDSNPGWWLRKQPS